MTRAEKVAEAQRLRAQGLLLRQIAYQMGAPLKTVSGWLSDPDLSKQRARRQGYSNSCVDCGAPTDGSGGFATRRARCVRCSRARQHEERYWTRERAVEALRAWAEELGRTPTATDLHNGKGPFSQTITDREFGSWSAALAAAGLPANKVGGARRKRAIVA